MGYKKRILIAEDDHNIRRLTAEQFKRLGFEVLMARDGRQAISQCRRAIQHGEDFDVILCDLNMPYHTGLEVFRTLPDRQKSRFILWSGGGTTRTPDGLGYSAAKDLSSDEMQELVEIVMAQDESEEESVQGQWSEYNQFQHEIDVGTITIVVTRYNDINDEHHVSAEWHLRLPGLGHESLETRDLDQAKTNALHRSHYLLKKKREEFTNSMAEIERVLDANAPPIEVGDVVSAAGGYEGIVMEIEGTPDSDWLAGQMDSRMRSRASNERWFTVFPFSGGSALSPESITKRLRETTSDDFDNCYKSANGFAKDDLDKLFPQYGDKK